MSITIGDAILYIRGNREGLDKDLGATESQTKGWASKIGGFMTNAMSFATGGLILKGVETLVGGIGKIGSAVNEWAGTLDDMGDVLGTTNEESAGLAVAIKGVGGSVEGLTGQMAFMARGLLTAEGEIGPVGETLGNLGIAFQDANGEMLPTTDILTGVADKLADMPDGLQKTQLMMAIFGKSGKDLSDTMNALADGGFEAAKQKAKDLGLALSEDTTNASIKLGQQMNTLKMAGQGLFVTLGANLLPIISPIVTWFTKLAMDAMPMLTQGIANVMSWLQPLGTWFVEVGWPKIQEFAALIWTQLGPGLAQLASWIQDLAAFLLPLLQAAIAFVVDHWKIFAVIAGIIVAVIVAINAPIAAIIAVIVLLATAWANNWGGIQTKVTTVVNFIKGLIQGFLTLVRAWWDEHGAAVMAIVTNFMETIKKVIDTIIKNIKDIFAAFQMAFRGDWEGFGQKLREVWDRTWAAIKEILGKAWDSLKIIVKNIIKSIVTFFTETNWKKVGIDIVKGIANGITNAIDWVIKAIMNMAAAIIAAIKGFLGISSPSKLFALEVGRPMAAGVGEGFEAQMERVRTQMGNYLMELAPRFGGNGIRTTNNNAHTLNIFTNAPVEPLVQDFGMMKAMSG